MSRIISVILFLVLAMPVHAAEPAPDEIAACSAWLQAEVTLLRPSLVLPVGKLAINPQTQR